MRLNIDLWSIKLFVWLLGTSGELLDSHLFFYVPPPPRLRRDLAEALRATAGRYSELAELYARHGRLARAAQLDAIAEHHFQLAPGDDNPPEAGAVAMPVPRPWIFTDAASRISLPASKPDAGPLSITPIFASTVTP